MANVERREILRHINRVIGENLEVGDYYRLVTLVALLPEAAEDRNDALYQLSAGSIPKGVELVGVTSGHAPMELQACMALVEHPAAMAETVEFLAASHNMAMAHIAVNQVENANSAPAAPAANYLDPFAKVREFFRAAGLVALGMLAGTTFFG